MVKPRLTPVLLMAVSALLFSLPAFAAFEAFVDRNPVAEGESMTLTLQSDKSLSSDPDLSVLQPDFDVLGQSSGSSMQIVNGSATRSVLWQITLIPKRSGQLVIPSIRAGQVATMPIVLNVSKTSQSAQQSGELFLEVGAEPRTAYVQQQIIYTVRLYSAANLGSQNTLSEPVFPGMDARVERMGEDRSFQTARNGVEYSVIERRYAVYPQKSGQFNSSEIQFDGEIIESSQGRGSFMFDPFSQRSRHKRVSSKKLIFTIKPAPVTATPWLPATQLKLSEQWSSNPLKFTANTPVTRTLVIAADGLTAAQLPVLESAAIDGIKQYPDQPDLKNNKDDHGVSSVRTQKIALLPERAGSFTLPAIEVRWWNVETDKMEVASLPERHITVLPASDAGVNPAISLQSDSAVSGAAVSVPLSVENNAVYKWLSLFLGAGWLITLLLWWQQSRKSSLKAGAGDAQSLKQIEHQFKKSCLENNAAGAKSGLLAWARLRWPAHPPTSLTSISSLCPPELASAINELDRVLYGRAEGVWLGAALWNLFDESKPGPDDMSDETGEPLKPLYRSGL